MTKFFVIVFLAAFAAFNANAQTTKQVAAAPETAAATQMKDAELRTRCLSLFNGTRYRGHVVNPYELYVRGMDVTYTFNTDGELVTSSDGLRRACHISFSWVNEKQDFARGTRMWFYGSVLRWGHPTDPNNWVQFEVRPDNTLLRTGRMRVPRLKAFGKPVEGEVDVYDSGTIVFRKL